jgi:uncharacterized protein
MSVLKEANGFFRKGTGGRRIFVLWGALLILSAGLILLLESLHLPAALLLGPMAAAILLAAAGGKLSVPRWPFFAAQTLLGCMIARVITPSTLSAVRNDWLLFLIACLGLVVASAMLGWLMARLRILPGTTAIWGSTPGAATAMVLLADAYGADVRLVAFMQYLRVVFVALAATIISRIWTTSSGHQEIGMVWFPPTDWIAFAETLALACGGGIIAHLLRIPAGALLVPMIIGVVLHLSGVMDIVLPPWVLAASYALIGWNIGSRFTRPILIYAARALPGVVASILVLMAIGGAFAVLLTAVAGVDPLTAYLATSPGGADSVAIIAASTKVDVPFVMAMQTARFVVVLFLGPNMARLVARWAGVSEEQT